MAVVVARGVRVAGAGCRVSGSRFPVSGFRFQVPDEQWVGLRATGDSKRYALTSVERIRGALSAIRTENDLEEELSRPFRRDIELASKLEGDVLILGAGGKMGPTLARRVAAAFASAGSPNRTYAVSRFSDEKQHKRLASLGIEAIRADLWNQRQRTALPRSPNILYLVGTKFGTEGDEPGTWATNSFLAGKMAECFPDSRIVALSTGNVYPLVEPVSGGCVETDAPAPISEYAQSCLGRERILEHFSRQNGTAVTILRLNYAVEARYGVLLDIGQRVLARKPVPLGTGYFNVIWQGDANSCAFRSLGMATSPPRILNLTGPEIVSVKQVALDFGDRFGVPVDFQGDEQPTAFLSDASLCHQLLGAPRVGLGQLIDLTADWIGRGGVTLDKPTRFQVRNGRF